KGKAKTKKSRHRTERAFGHDRILCQNVAERERNSQRSTSTAGFRLRHVTLNPFGVGADNGADELAAAIVNVNLRNRMDAVLPHHRRVPIDDVDLAQRNLRIRLCHLLEGWRDHSARAAPVRIKINNRHVAECQMPCDVHLRAVTDHFNWLTALRNESSRSAKPVLLVF